MPFFALTCHPSTPCAAVRHVQVDALRNDNELWLRYSLEGDIAALRLPESGPPRRDDGLWRHTCFEAFLKCRPGAADYREFNFAPSGAWAVYHFDAYREGIAVVELEPPAIVVLRGRRLLELDVRVKLDGLALNDADSRLGLSAVIEDNAGGLSYWACAHAPGKPDFHHPGSFICPLA